MSQFLHRMNEDEEDQQGTHEDKEESLHEEEDEELQEEMLEKDFDAEGDLDEENNA